MERFICRLCPGQRSSWGFRQNRRGAQCCSGKFKEWQVCRCNMVCGKGFRKQEGCPPGNCLRRLGQRRKDRRRGHRVGWTFGGLAECISLVEPLALGQYGWNEEQS